MRKSKFSEQQIALHVNNRERMCRKMGNSEAPSIAGSSWVLLRREIQREDKDAAGLVRRCDSVERSNRPKPDLLRQGISVAPSIVE